MTTTDKHQLAEAAYKGTLTLSQVEATSKEDLQTGQYAGTTLLYWACGYCRVEIVEAILNKGVDVNQLPAAPLISACYYGKWDNARLLLARGADAKISHGGSIFYATQKDAPADVIEALIEGGGDPELKTQAGEKSALDIAIERNNTELISLFSQYIKPTKAANFLA
jgi:ankyrin repeat protein